MRFVLRFSLCGLRMEDRKGGMKNKKRLPAESAVVPLSPLNFKFPYRSSTLYRLLQL